MTKTVLDIAVVTAVRTLVVSVDSDLLAAGDANEGGVGLSLDLVHMRVPPPVSAFIAAVLLKISPAMGLFPRLPFFRVRNVLQMLQGRKNDNLDTELV